jgi:hypothetical protein
MLHSNDKIEHLEGSIAHVQHTLDNAQRVLGAAGAAQAKAEEVHSTVRRLVVGVAVASVVLALLLAARRRHA